MPLTLLLLILVAFFFFWSLPRGFFFVLVSSETIDNEAKRVRRRVGPAAAVHPVRAEAMRVLGDDDPDRFFFSHFTSRLPVNECFFFFSLSKGKEEI